MKITSVLLMIFGVCRIAAAQEFHHHFVDQFLVSVNRTMEVNYDGDKNGYGFGLGVYHTFLPSDDFFIVIGIEFNRTQEIKDPVYVGHFGTILKAAYSKNCISLPFQFKINFGKKVKFYITGGGFGDIVLSSTLQGLFHTYLPDGNGNVQHKYTDIKRDAKLRSAPGFSFGAGVRIPGKRFDVVLGPEYKQIVQEDSPFEDILLEKYMRLNVGIQLK